MAKKKFTTYLENKFISELKARSYEESVLRNKKVSAADVLNELLEKHLKVREEFLKEN